MPGECQVACGSTISNARLTAKSANMTICAMANAVLRWEPLRSVAKSLARTLAEANDSQAWARRDSVFMSGEIRNMGLGL